MSDHLYLGIMSGTSLDGIDVAACRFENQHIELVAFHSKGWKPEMRERIMNMATSKVVEMDELVRMHFQLAREYAEAVEATLFEANISATQIRAIGLHGQTVRHLPSSEVPSTLQLGSGAALAAMSGIDVVSDFRSADMALGGQGAPLMPMFDFHFLRSETLDRLVVNIGGIANVTWLPRMTAHADRAEAEDVIAFDTGPGNMLLDSITRRYFGKPFDTNGEIARSGEIDPELLGEFLSLPYFASPPPKSTGRELFSESFLHNLNDNIAAKKLLAEDALATLTELTAVTIAKSFEFFPARSRELEIIVSGGGAFNSYLLERLKANAPTYASIRSSDTYNIPPKAKEAIAFAFFARAFVEEIPIHLPGTTGASRRTTLGSMSRGK